MPHCGAEANDVHRTTPPTVQTGSCTACGLLWAATATGPAAIAGVLLTPALRGGALLASLRAEVAQRKEHPVVTVTLCLPTGELFNLDSMASADTVVWRCRRCEGESTARYRPAVHTDAVEHLVAEHRASIAPQPGRSSVERVRPP